GQINQANIDKNYRKIIGVTSTIVNGETTTTVSPSDMTSPAYKAGIMDGDIVVKINDVP
ncbi:MAG TPA: RIP metalloprotease RseP, partial [Clostridiales bacterium]|nr:RIP metalloprotease RseP [Clostridiales bacterium]